MSKLSLTLFWEYDEVNNSLKQLPYLFATYLVSSMIILNNY